MADLLRNSRLFALPHPLPVPIKPSTRLLPRTSAAASIVDSDTATLPHPTHAAIETTEGSLARGDWGLKRPLPLRSTTRTSTPSIKIDNLDSIDYITDFSSASDLVRTLEKVQELDISVSVLSRDRRLSNYQPPPKSVFESEVDNTAVAANSGQERWKFTGPYLAGQNAGEFNDYLARKVKGRKSDFREFLRQRLIRSQAAVRQQEMPESGEELGSVEVTEEEVDGFVKRLRKDQAAMHRLLRDFLDLPRDQSNKAQSTYDDQGPPITHPSAGLSYLRTSSHTFNHPVNGPQEDKSPVLGRVLKPQSIARQEKSKAVLSVAGVAVEDPRQPFTKVDETPGIAQLDPDMVGGGKIWLQPKRASIDVKGRINIEVKRADKNAIDVLTADRGESQPDELPAAAIEAATNRDVPDLAPLRTGTARGPLTYGLGDVPTSGRAKPFEGQSDITALLGQALRGGKKTP